MEDLTSLMMETRSNSALFKRAEQLRRWAESETNKESHVLKDKPRKIKFSDGCIFLAACSAGDKLEVKRLLDKGADINTANVDGLTALHQACIDDNLDMVEFLVENGADVNCGDNEGWTPLHATASCAFVSIAKYLIDNGANVAAVNNDGELPSDIAESDDMEELLQHEIEKRGIDCTMARNEEERLMLEDANRWYNNKSIKERLHHKTGATALHVASAKGYIKVMSILLKAGSNVNSQDFDGWTPLHASAHWGQRESCEILAEAFCDMDIKNFAGQTAIDVADIDLIKFLEELRKKQQAMRKEKAQIQPIIDNKIQTRPRYIENAIKDKLRIDVNNISNKDSKNFDSEESGTEESSEEESSEESNVDKKNKANKEEKSREIISVEKSKEQKAKEEPSKIREPPKQTPSLVEYEETPASWRQGTVRKTGSNISLDSANEEITEVTLRNPNKPSNEPSNNRELTIEEPKSTRPTSVPPTIVPPTIVPPTVVPPTIIQEDRSQNPLALGWRPRSYQAKYPTTNYFTPIFVKSPISTSSSLPSSPYLSRKKEMDTSSVAAPPSLSLIIPTPLTTTAVSKPASSMSPTTTTLTTTTPTSTTPTTTSSTPPLFAPETPTTALIRRSFVPPVRDDESESQRKAHAKRVRETRRSTQGVTMDDLKSAEQYVKKQQENQQNSIDTNVNSVNKENQATIETKYNRLSHNSQDDVKSRDGENELKSDDDRNKLVVGGEVKGEEDKRGFSDRGLRSGRYGSSGSLSDVSKSDVSSSRYSDRSDRHSRASSVGSITSQNNNNEDLDYKKLYEEAAQENERLKEKLKEFEQEVEDAKQQLERASQNNARNSTTDAEKRERRALERKLSEMEEELKHMNKLKAENEKLKAENRALTRVVSKLTK